MANYDRVNKLGCRFTPQKNFPVIAMLFEIHYKPWIDFYSVTTRKNSTNDIISSLKNLLCLVEKYYSLATNLRK